MPLSFVDMQTLFARYFYFVKSICFRPAQTRYAINLVAVRQHIEFVRTYRVIFDISKNEVRDLYRRIQALIEFILAHPMSKINTTFAIFCIWLYIGIYSVFSFVSNGGSLDWRGLTCEQMLERIIPKTQS